MSGENVRPAGAIRHKLKQAAYRHLKRHLEKHLKEAPENCIFSGFVEMPGLGSEVGVCTHTDKDGDRLCDGRFNPELAANCPLFAHRKTKEAVKAEFHDFLGNSTIAAVAARYPDVAALLWVLQNDAPGRDVPDTEGEDWTPGGDVEVVLKHLRLSAPDTKVAAEAQSLIEDLLESLHNTREILGEKIKEVDGLKGDLHKSREKLKEALESKEKELPAVRKRPWWKFWGT